MSPIPFITALALLLAMIAPVSEAGAAPLCVTNGDDHDLVFTAEARAGARLVQELAPGQALCVEDAAGAGGVVSVFEHRDEIEGCSRLVAAGQQETLLEFATFDRCHWSSHDQ